MIIYYSLFSTNLLPMRPICVRGDELDWVN